MGFARTSARVLGWGSVAIGIWGLVHPKSLTRLLGDDPELGRCLGVRDALVGLALLKVPGPLPLGLRLASDLHDAVRLRHRSPTVALGAAGVAVWDSSALAVDLMSNEGDRHPNS